MLHIILQVRNFCFSNGFNSHQKLQPAWGPLVPAIAGTFPPNLWKKTFCHPSHPISFQLLLLSQPLWNPLNLMCLRWFFCCWKKTFNVCSLPTSHKCLVIKMLILLLPLLHPIHHPTLGNLTEKHCSSTIQVKKGFCRNRCLNQLC